MIKNILIEDLRSEAVDIMNKTYLELGQNPTEETIVSFSYILAEDLSRDFYNMEMPDIWEAFRIGVRQTEIFHLQVKTYYKWIRDHRQIIWDNETIEPNMQDKRLNYRTRQGTGMKRINIKDIKQLKQ
tara:strand:+ start:2239 stop:2622 length:384 start_codon:yes stop_codon:yes gene_type:complete